MDSKKQIRQTIRMVLKHWATETNRSIGISLILTNDTSRGWYFFLAFVGRGGVVVGVSEGFLAGGIWGDLAGELNWAILLTSGVFDALGLSPRVGGLGAGEMEEEIETGTPKIESEHCI